MSPKNSKTLLITVKDGATSLPLSGVTVELEGSSGYDVTKITGVGFIGQTDWSGGSGQATSTDVTQYLSSDGNIETQDPVGDIELKKFFGDYSTSGTLTSSSFDTGSASNFQSVIWNPTSQPVAVGTPNIRVQIATNNDGGTWDYLGPDGTTGTYYTMSNQNIFSGSSGNRYVRYKVYFDTASTTSTPNLSDISFTFTSNCTPPGQVWFQGLSTGSYTIHLSKTGYASQDINISIDSAWQSQDVTLIPS